MNLPGSICYLCLMNGETLIEFRQNIKDHNLVLVKLDNQYGIISSLEPMALNKLNKLKPILPPEDFCVLITDIGQLHDYVEQVPEIAWDIVDYEEKALIVKYPKVQNLPPELLMNGQRVGIMLLKNHPLEKPLYNYGKGVLFKYGLSSEIANRNLTHFDYVLNLGESGFNLFTPKTIQLELNGEIKFL